MNLFVRAVVGESDKLFNSGAVDKLAAKFAWTPVVAFSNGSLSGRKPGNLLDRRLRAIERVANGSRRIRYNNRLLAEYRNVVREYRNDVVEALFQILDSNRAVRVPKNALSRQLHNAVVKKCHWPGHDQHLIAAAVGGVSPILVVTEAAHRTCAGCVSSCVHVEIEHLA